MARDIHKGRNHLNFSEWSSVDEDERHDDLQTCWEQVESGEMPPWFYVFPMHPAAKLSETDKAQLKSYFLRNVTTPEPARPAHLSEGKSKGRREQRVLFRRRTLFRRTARARRRWSQASRDGSVATQRTQILASMGHCRYNIDDACFRIYGGTTPRVLSNIRNVKSGESSPLALAIPMLVALTGCVGSIVSASEAGTRRRDHGFRYWRIGLRSIRIWFRYRRIGLRWIRQRCRCG